MNYRKFARSIINNFLRLFILTIFKAHTSDLNQDIHNLSGIRHSQNYPLPVQIIDDYLGYLTRKR
jgi:hypothetical protein